MTNEEAANVMKKYTEDYCGNTISKIVSDAHKMAISALERDRWIDVTEKLPEKPEIVLVTQVKQVDGEIVRVTRSMMFDGHSFCAYGSTQQGIWAWRPLPEPYSESEGEHER
jgi:hypothetical protein